MFEQDAGGRDQNRRQQIDPSLKIADESKAHMGVILVKVNVLP